jgi:PAS domain S-box-containing protein
VSLFSRKKTKPVVSIKSISVASGNLLRQQAFDNSLHANIISAFGSGEILIANNAACKLLGYSKRELQSFTRSMIFDTQDNGFKKMLQENLKQGNSISDVTAIKKNGKRVSCEITSAVFLDEKGTKKVITTIGDMSQGILNQRNIDIKNEKLVADNIVIAKSKQKDIDIKNEKLVADNISIAKSKQKDIDIKNEKLVADNISIAKSKQKDIDIKNEKLVADNISIAKSKQKDIDIKNEKLVADNIVIAKSKQKDIDIKNEKLVADNIKIAKAMQKDIDVRQNKLREKQISDAREDARNLERSDIGKELHDNVNQLLGASRLYLEMGKRGGIDSEMFFGRSSQYTLSAIEEIRKLTKGLITDIIKNLGLRVAIENIAHDTMEVSPLEIHCDLGSFIENSVNDKFKLNAFRIVQEQLNNILKHAKATKVKLNLSQQKKSLSLTITDNGVGFDTSKNRIGIGIENIKSRAKAYNAAARFVSHPGNGCVLGITFPMTDAIRR